MDTSCSTAAAETLKETFIGSVKISLNSIRSEDASTADSRALDTANIRRLIRIFQIEGCHPELWPIVAVIDDVVLQRALANSNLSPSDLSSGENFLNIPDGLQVLCVHGKHRLQAGREFLPSKKRWWNVHLCSKSRE